MSTRLSFILPIDLLKKRRLIARNFFNFHKHSYYCINVRSASSLLNIYKEINKGGHKKIVLKVLFNDILAT
jgi:hypothetical protein